MSMGFPRQEYWSRLPCPLPGDLPDRGIEPVSFMFPALAGGSFTTSTTWDTPWQLSTQVQSGQSKLATRMIFLYLPWEQLLRVQWKNFQNEFLMPDTRMKTSVPIRLK